MIDYDAGREEPVEPVPVMRAAARQDDAALARRGGGRARDRDRPRADRGGAARADLDARAPAVGCERVGDPGRTRTGRSGMWCSTTPGSRPAELGRLDGRVGAAPAASSSPNWIGSELGDEAPPSGRGRSDGLGVRGAGAADWRRCRGRAGSRSSPGSGRYIPRTRPEWLTELDEDALADLFLSALTDRPARVRFPRRDRRHARARPPARRARRPWSPTGLPRSTGWERGLLRAGARAAAETGSAAIVRLDPRRRDGLEVLEVMTERRARAGARRLQQHRRLRPRPRRAARAGRGGSDLEVVLRLRGSPRPGLATATDAERADAVAALLAEGHRRQVLACGIWTKAALHEYGGWGYDHLPTTVVPMLRERGLSLGGPQRPPRHRTPPPPRPPLTAARRGLRSLTGRHPARSDRSGA